MVVFKYCNGISYKKIILKEFCLQALNAVTLCLGPLSRNSKKFDEYPPLVLYLRKFKQGATIYMTPFHERGTNHNFF